MKIKDALVVIFETYIGALIIAIVVFPGLIVDKDVNPLLLGVIIFILLAWILTRITDKEKRVLTHGRYLKFRSDLYDAICKVKGMEVYKNIKYSEFINQWMINNLYPEMIDEFSEKICDEMIKAEVIEILDYYIYPVTREAAICFPALGELMLQSWFQYTDYIIKSGGRTK